MGRPATRPESRCVQAETCATSTRASRTLIAKPPRPRALPRRGFTMLLATSFLLPAPGRVRSVTPGTLGTSKMPRASSCSGIGRSIHRPVGSAPGIRFGFQSCFPCCIYQKGGVNCRQYRFTKMVSSRATIAGRSLTNFLVSSQRLCQGGNPHAFT